MYNKFSIEYQVTINSKCVSKISNLIFAVNKEAAIGLFMFLNPTAKIIAIKEK